MLEEKHCHASMSLLCASVDCYVCVNIKCNMQNDNPICKVALHLVLKFTFYITILATFGAK